MIKKKINLIITEEKIALKNYVINYEEKEMIPLTKEETFYKKQEECHICKEKFCIDKMMKIILIEKRSKIIVIAQENLEELLVANVT